MMTALTANQHGLLLTLRNLTFGPRTAGSWGSGSCGEEAVFCDTLVTNAQPQALVTNRIVPTSSLTRRPGNETPATNVSK